MNFSVEESAPQGYRVGVLYFRLAPNPTYATTYLCRLVDPPLGLEVISEFQEFQEFKTR